ncbi:MAG: sulfurtransferase [Candidatus Krumholzibacteria bacterium]|nr:sulfurtransferase [Candidatus Krumholzibacteria bacterium]
MKKNLTIIAAIVLAMLFSQGINAQVISVKELAELMDGGDVVIVSARKSADYAKVHLPGAINIWHKDLYQDGDIPAVCKKSDEIAAYLGTRGISADKTVVIYDSGKSRFAGRLYWILKCAGCKDVRILDGHMKMWRKGRKKVTKTATEIAAVEFGGTADKSICIPMADVKASLGQDGVMLVDVRDPEEYAGEKGITERKGHLPGAVRFDFDSILNADGTVKDKAELQAVFTAAGIVSDKQIILYCDTSVRAGMIFMVLNAILEYPNVRVYDGAMSEWAVDPANPLDKG